MEKSGVGKEFAETGIGLAFPEVQHGGMSVEAIAEIKFIVKYHWEIRYFDYPFIKSVFCIQVAEVNRFSSLGARWVCCMFFFFPLMVRLTGM